MCSESHHILCSMFTECVCYARGMRTCSAAVAGSMATHWLYSAPSRSSMDAAFSWPGFHTTVSLKPLLRTRMVRLPAESCTATSSAAALTNIQSHQSNTWRKGVLVHCSGHQWPPVANLPNMPRPVCNTIMHTSIPRACKGYVSPSLDECFWQSSR